MSSKLIILTGEFENLAFLLEIYTTLQQLLRTTDEKLTTNHK